MFDSTYTRLQMNPMFFRSLALALCLLFGWSADVAAQKKYTISGTVKDAANGELMIATNVFVEPSMKGTTTNLYGFFSLTVPEGTHTLKVSFPRL
jgi:hypothetical protein